jgi:LuxR family maltose regulon positive regulatory protein
VKRINSDLDRKLTLISAPAGFGKTTLLSEWAKINKRSIAWVSLDEEDNNPNRFWSYFITSITTIHEDIGGALLTNLQSQQPPSMNEILTDLINQIVSANLIPFIIVLDDYHLIDTSGIHEGIAFLIENCPPSLHLVISTRSDPMLPLGRWRVRGEMNELRTGDLRFTLREATDFFNGILDLDIRREDIEALERRTEGWIAGLQMAAISIKGRLQTQDSAGLSEFIAAFTGSHRFVLDYLVEEVINQQPPKVKDFLLKTSILDRFNAPLCQAVTGYADNRDILEYLDRTNLFLIPLDEERSWYRYHHLFRDLLHNLLEREYLSQVSILHSTASEWFESNGLLAEAVKYALAMDDVERFARLIAGNAVYLIYLGELHTIERWLRALPDETMCSSPWLCVAHAWVNAYLGEHDMVNSLLENTQQILVDPGTGGQFDEQQKSEIYAHISLIQGFRDFFIGDFEQGTARIRTALENLSTGDFVVRSYATGLLGAMLRGKGDLCEAETLIEESIRLSRETGLVQLAADAITDLMSLRVSQGRLQDAAAAGFEALQLDKAYCEQFEKHLFTVGRIHYFFGNIYLNWNELEAALRHLTMCLELAEKWGKADEIALCHSGMAWVLLAQGDSKSALNAMRQAKKVARKISPRWEALGNLAEARLHLRLGNVSEAIQLSQGFGFQIDQPVDYVNISEHLFLARLLSEQGKDSEASALLEHLKDVAESIGALGDLLPILVTQAIIHQKMGQKTQAVDTLSGALTLAEPEKSVRVFIDGGDKMAKLLRCLAPGHDSYPFAMQLLAAIGSETEGQPVPGLLEPLSERELDVLNLLATPATHAEIAEQLYISRNTVRSHVKRIYSKLNVNNRIQAIEKARELCVIT